MEIHVGFHEVLADGDQLGEKGLGFALGVLAAD